MEQADQQVDPHHIDAAEQSSSVNVEDSEENSEHHDEEEDECRVCRGPAEEG